MSRNSFKASTFHLIAASTGVLLGITYFLIKASDAVGGLRVFGIASLFMGTAISATDFRGFQKHFRSLGLVVRGLLFAATQILLCEAMRLGTASSSISSSVLGTIVGVAGGRYILKESGQGASNIGLIVGLIGSGLALEMSQLTYLSAIGGGILGINSTLTRSLLRTGKMSVRIAVGIPLMYASAIMLAYHWMFLDNYLPKESIPWNIVFWFSICLLLVQGLSALVLKHLDSQLAASYSLTRLPTVAVLEFLFFGRVLPIQTILGMCLIVLGATYVYNDRAKSQN